MVFWTGILVGGLFVWLAVKIGFYETWAVLFNIVISIYLSIFATPVIIHNVPAAGDTVYGHALTLLATAIGTFLVLQGISYTLITSQFKVTFPKIFDIVGSGFLGFLAGFLVLSFAAFLICVTPISQNKFINEIGLNRQSQQANISYICWWCNLVNKVAASDSNYTTEETVNWLLQSAEEKTRDDSVEPDKLKKSPDSNNT